jgi:photosystem II stability/assembly factor-like uncharacterized protein
VTVSDEALADAKGISVDQVRVLRESRGTTNETLDTLSEGAIRRALLRLERPDRPALRAEFRWRQTLGEDGAEPPPLAKETAVTELFVATINDAGPQTAGVPTGIDGATPAGIARAGAGLDAAAWEWLGPGNIGGRVRGIVIDPVDPRRMWAASAGGGVWHSRDGGASWSTVGDFIGNLACSCITRDPTTGTLYAGTGEGFGNADALAGNGIFASDDGLTWTVLPGTRVREFRFVNRIAATGSGAVLVASPLGIFRNADPRREAWTQVLSAQVGSVASERWFTDVKADPRGNGRVVAGAKGTGEAWFSTDDGLTWTVATHEGAWLGRVELAYAAKDPDIVYASVEMENGEIWRSTDGGATFVPRRTRTPAGGAAPYLGDQGWYGNAIWAGDPTDENLVIVGGVNIWRSTDGGNVLTEISTWWAHPGSPHADQHAIVAHPGYDGSGERTIFFGNDGGVCSAPDLAAVGNEDRPPFTAGWEVPTASLAVTQFYGGAGNAQSGKIVGGAQDNGTLCFDPDQGPQRWTTIFGGDGGWCAADPSDPAVFYGEYVFLSIHRNTDGGTTDDQAGDRYIHGEFFNEDEGEWDWKPSPFRVPDAKALPGQPPKALFIAPFVLDPNEPNRLLAGGMSLWRTNDARTPNTTTTGPSWASIKDPIDPGGPTAAISALAVASGDSDMVWVGHANGAVFRTADGTADQPTWQPATPAAVPRRYCTGITIDPADSRHVYVYFGGFARGNLWATRDGGATWADLSGTLPTAPVRALAIHPRRSELVYAGTEVGLFASEDAGATWSPTNEGPTNCSVDDLFWMDESLVSVTHGRGMFRADLSDAVRDEDGSGQAGSSEAEAAHVEGAPFPPVRSRRLGQEGDRVPRVPTGPAETEDAGRGGD